MDPIGLVGAVAVLLKLSQSVLDPLQQLQSDSSTRAIKSLQAEVSALYEILQGLQPLVVGHEAEQSIIPASLLAACEETLRSIVKLVKKSHSGPKFAQAMTRILRQDEMDRLKRDLDRQKSTFALFLSNYTRHVSIRCYAPIKNAE